MRYATLSLFVMAVLVIVFAHTNSSVEPVFAQGYVAPEKQGLISFSVPADNGGQHIVLIDPNSRVLSVYRIDAVSGEIGLKSVRNINWDMLIEEFNSGKPSPNDIRSMIEK